ncbi:hypothetical protein TNCV_2254661 [Trichonephila clavipes]|nr:hypothetical protein TNCV_2254661 [Trichonephila clavipes]
MNAARYIEILTHFMKRLRMIEPRTHNKVNGFLLTTMLTLHGQYHQTVPAKKKEGGEVQIEHPPFPPYPNPPDFFLFPRLKLALKEKRFDDISDIERKRRGF